MGCDWDIKKNNGTSDDPDWETVANIFRLCSGNHSKIWKKYGFNRCIMHGHKGTVVNDYLTPIIKKMKEAGLHLYTDAQVNCKDPIWNWGIGLPEKEHEEVVLYQLNYYRSLAIEFPDDVWVGDQTYYMGEYTMSDGKVVEGQDMDYFDYAF